MAFDRPFRKSSLDRILYLLSIEQIYSSFRYLCYGQLEY